MINQISKNPQDVLERQQLYEIKRTEGCKACSLRDLRALAFDAVVCSIPGNYPKPIYCNEWLYDEGESRGANQDAA